MRTPEQIGNLRLALSTRFGIFAKFLSDDEIDNYANRLQREVDNLTYNWEIRVRFQDTKVQDWHAVKKEPTCPTCSIGDIRIKCNELLDKYPKIHSIRVNIVEQPDEPIIFAR